MYLPTEALKRVALHLDIIYLHAEAFGRKTEYQSSFSIKGLRLHFVPLTDGSAVCGHSGSGKRQLIPKCAGESASRPALDHVPGVVNDRSGLACGENDGGQGLKAHQTRGG